MTKEIKIRQRKDTCHYETSIEESRMGGWFPKFIGYGFTQEVADTNAIIKLCQKKKQQYKRNGLKH